MANILLCKKYYNFNQDHSTHIDRITSEFKSPDLVITQSGMFGGIIVINKKGQKRLYDELKKRFK